MESDKTLNIENDIRLEILSFSAIAEKYSVTIYDVVDVWLAMCESEHEQNINN